MTHLEQAIPATRTKGHPVSRHTHATDSIFMACEDADAFALEGVPDITVVVIVAGEQHTTGDGEGDGRDAAKDIVVGVAVEFTVCAQVKELAGGVVGPGGKGVAVGEEPGGISKRSTRRRVVLTGRH